MYNLKKKMYFNMFEVITKKSPTKYGKNKIVVKDNGIINT